MYPGTSLLIRVCTFHPLLSPLTSFHFLTRDSIFVFPRPSRNFSYLNLPQLPLSICRPGGRVLQHWYVHPTGTLLFFFFLPPVFSLLPAAGIFGSFIQLFGRWKNKGCTQYLKCAFIVDLHGRTRTPLQRGVFLANLANACSLCLKMAAVVVW